MDPMTSVGGRAVSGNGSVVEVTEATFATEVLQSPVPVLLDLWADWCASCRVLDNTVTELARTAGSRLKVCRLDVGRNPRLASFYHVMSVPTLLFMRRGEVVGQHLGPAAVAMLRQKVESHLGLQL
jgi:thioredoxin